MITTSQSPPKGLLSMSSTNTGRLLPPTTPMRRFLYKAELMRPFQLALGKRNREQSLSASADAFQVPVPPATTTAASGVCLLTTAETTGQLLSVGPSNPGQPQDHDQPQPRPQPQHPCARLAIQQHDQPLDAIVITTLPHYPFCCHEDLLTMSRAQLVQVAEVFNAHLPCSSEARIDVSERASEGDMRRCIEVLCGIVGRPPPNVPAAPKAVRSRVVRTCIGSAGSYNCGGIWRDDEDFRAQENSEVLISPSSSPLTMRLPRKRGVGVGVGPSLLSSSSGQLERLEEDEEEEECDEGDVFVNHRAPKRRKLSDAFAAPIRTLYHGYGRRHGAQPTRNMDVDETPTPTRRRSDRSSLAFPAHHLGDASASFPGATGDNDSDDDVDMSMQSPSPLQHRSRSFGVPPPLGSHLNRKMHLGSRSKTKSVRRSASKRAQAQQICRPMGKLRMNSSDSPTGAAF